MSDAQTPRRGHPYQIDIGICCHFLDGCDHLDPKMTVLVARRTLIRRRSALHDRVQRVQVR